MDIAAGFMLSHFECFLSASWETKGKGGSGAGTFESTNTHTHTTIATFPLAPADDAVYAFLTGCWSAQKMVEFKIHSAGIIN